MSRPDGRPPEPPPGDRRGTADSVRVVVGDDHPTFLEAVVELLGEEPGIEVCGVAEDEETLLAALACLAPDVVVVDLSLRDADGIALVGEIARSHPSMRIVVLSGHDEHLYGRRAGHAGAAAYVPKEEAGSRLVAALLSVVAASAPD